MARQAAGQRVSAVPDADGQSNPQLDQQGNHPGFGQQPEGLPAALPRRDTFVHGRASVYADAGENAGIHGFGDAGEAFAAICGDGEIWVSQSGVAGTGGSAGGEVDEGEIFEVWGDGGKSRGGRGN